MLGSHAWDGGGDARACCMRAAADARPRRRRLERFVLAGVRALHSQASSTAPALAAGDIQQRHL